MLIAFILALVVIQVLLTFVHLTVYAMLAMAFGIGGRAMEVFVIVLGLTFLTASLLSHWFKNRLVAWYYAAAAYWFGLVHFLFIGAVGFYCVATALYAANYYVHPAILGAIALGALFMLHTYGTWQSGRAEIERVTIQLPGLPSAWRGKKIVFVSDLHLGNIHRAGFSAKVVRKIRALAPEAVLIGGDLYDGTSCDPAPLIEPFRALRPPLGTFYVTGNHEYYLPSREFTDALAAMRELGIRILDNEAVDMDGIALVGVADQAVHKKEDFEKIIKGIPIPKDRPGILMKHEPSHLEIAHDAGISLVLSGHTHHGQIFPLNYLTKAIYHGFDYGLKRLNAMRVYTSSGVGTWGPPLRLWTKSEIVCITFA